MKRSRSALAVAILAAGAIGALAVAVSPAMAIEWNGAGANDYWATGANWVGGVAPADGEEARFNMGGAINVDLNGTAVNLPNSTLFIRNVAPLIVEDLLNPANPAAITVDIFHIQQYSRPRSQIRVPVTANTEIRSRYRLGGVEFYEELNTPEVDLGRGDIYLYGDVNATTEFKVVKDDSTTNAYLRENPDTAAVPTLTTPTVLVDDQTSTFYAGGVVDTDTVTVTNGGRYFAEIDGALGDATTNVTVSNGGFLQINVAQTSLASIDVGPFSVLAGDLAGATFGGGGTVSLVEDAVLAPAVGSPVPTRADLGGDAILYQGATTSNKTLVVGDNETDAIYKGAAVGAFYGTGTMDGVSITAETGSGNLKVVYAGAGCPSTRNNNKLYGDGTSTTADISVLNGANLRLIGAFNPDYDYVAGGEPTRIDTFNITGEVGKEAVGILDHYRTNGTHIKEGQTWNISRGKWTLQGYFPGGGQHGHVTLTDGILARPEGSFSAVNDDGFTLTLAGRTVVETHNAAYHGFLEELGANFSYSGLPVCTFTDNQNYAIDYSPAGANPILADLLINADLSSATYQKILFSTDLLIGHEKYLYNTLYRADDDDGVGTDTGAKIVPAGNQPAGEKAVIGFAAMGGRQNPIDMEVDATGGIVRCGTTDADRIMVANSGGFVTSIPNAAVWFKRAVTADELQIQSGTARFALDLSIPMLDIVAGAKLQMDGGTTATVTDTLSGTGSWTGGNGVLLAPGATVAPGYGVGELNKDGGILQFSDALTYAWELADPTLAPGTGWDMVWGDPLRFVGDPTQGMIIEILDAGLTGELDGSEIFAIAAGSFEIPPELLGHVDCRTSVPGWDAGGCQVFPVLDDPDFNGEDVLYLTGLVVTAGPGPDIIPEPATLSLLGLGALALLRRRRR